jgi:hypothetical protein
MRKLHRNWMTLAGTVAVTAGVAVSTALPAAAYTPGTATPSRPTYNAASGAYNFHCSYAHWRSGAKVTWHCNLQERDPITYALSTIQTHSGSWTPGPTSYTTGTGVWRLVVGQGQLCTQAYALSVDGGTPTKLACN